MKDMVTSVNKKRKIIFLLFFIVLVLIPINVNAVNMEPTGKFAGCGVHAPKKYADDTLVLCTQYKLDWPEGKLCSADDSLKPRTKAGLGAIIAWYNKNNSDANYVCAELALSSFFYNIIDSKNGREDYSSKLGTAKTAYDNAIIEYNNVNDLNNKVIDFKWNKSVVTKLDFKYNSTDDKYVAKVNVRTPSDKYNISCSTNYGDVDVKKENGNNYYTATVKVGKRRSGEEIILSCTPSYNYKSPSTYYSCGSKQNVATSTLITETKIGKTETISGSFIVSTNSTTPTTPTTPTTQPSYGSIRIYKRITNTTILITSSSPTFKLYQGTNCSGSEVNAEIIYGSGYVDFRNLPTGTYSLKEIVAPLGYQTPQYPDNCVIKNMTISSGTNNPQYVYNDSDCDVALTELGDNPTKLHLIELYNSYGVRNLLNFSHPSCVGEPICGSEESKCLSGSIYISDTFSQNNLSCYNEIVKNGSDTLYCLTKFYFTNDLSEDYIDSRGVGTFSSKSGQKIEALENATFLGNLIKTCYGYGIEASEDIPLKYSEYVGDVTFGGQKLLPIALNGNVGVNESINLTKTGDLLENGKGYSAQIRIKYLFPTVYVENGSGKKSNAFCENCKQIQNSFLSDFLSDGSSISLPFSITILNTHFVDKSDKNIYYNSCYYTPIQELVKNDKLRLEFRTIDTTNPFEKKERYIKDDGISYRKTSDNWCQKDQNGVNCNGNSTNTIVNSEIIESNNSYDKTKEGAKYVIELTPSDIKQIREYNKNTPYDNYDFTCQNNGEDCISNYLTKLRDEGVITTLINDKTGRK